MHIKEKLLVGTMVGIHVAFCIGLPALNPNESSSLAEIRMFQAFPILVLCVGIVCAFIIVFAIPLAKAPE